MVGDIVLRAKYVSASDLPIGTGPLLRLPTHWYAVPTDAGLRPAAKRA